MEKFKTVLTIANKQTSLGFGVVALLTAGGEQVFSSVVFQCPCSPELNFVYGLVFLLVPALALLLLGFILNKKTWKLLTGLCRKEKPCSCRKLAAAVTILAQISCSALVAPTTWVAVALLNGNYFECAMTGVRLSSYKKHLCGEKASSEQCQKDLFMFPCKKGLNEDQKADRDDVLLALRAESQIMGWLLIASIMLSNLMLTCLARCTSPISYMQLKFWRAYAQEENRLMDSYATEHAKELADRNLKSFFKKTPPQEIQTPSNKDWERISSLYKFCSKDHFYSTLHRFVEKQTTEVDSHMMRMESVKSADSVAVNPPAFDFVDSQMMP
ncbi:calcium homeostasis modulator protein 6 [Cheilinus undulatus]|uniref:calcium homeostasis modulator protein 6 n=1 Tax=Cheilinus undulatus TaxID=241271 RepID=UPI001BD2B6DA|nr:calcium homeostasis modulator protein 6 [Cheilinus undulatus]